MSNEAKSTMDVVSPMFFGLRSLVRSQKARLGNLSTLVFVRFATAGLGFLTTVKIANVIGKENFGELAYAFALGMYGAAIIRYGFNRTLVRDLVHFPDKFGHLVFASLALRLFLLFLVLAGLIIWKIFVSQMADLSWVIIVIIMCKSLLALDLQAVYDTWHEFKRHAIYNLVQRYVYFVLIWVVIVTSPGKLTLSWIGFALIISVILYLALQYSWAMKRIPHKINVSLLLGPVLSLLKQNVWIWMATIGTLSFSSLNQILLKHFRGTAELGGYAIAWQLVVVAQMLLLNISRIGNPATAKITRSGTDSKTRCNFLVKYAAVMLLVGLPICLPALICPELILRTLFRPEYLTAAPIMRVLAIYIMVFSLGQVASQYVISARMEKAYLYSVCMGGALSILLCIVLVPRLAGLGAGLVVLASHGFSMLLYLILVIRHLWSLRRFPAKQRI